MIASKVFAKPAVRFQCRKKKNPLLCNAANYLAPKSFNSSIASAFAINIAIAKANLIKHFIGNSGIVKISSVIEEVMCIGHHKYFSPLIASYEVRAVAYYFHSIKILTEYTNLSTITTTDKEPYDFTAIGVHTTINLDTEARQLIVAI